MRSPDHSVKRARPDGFIVAPDLLDRAELSALRQVIAGLVAAMAPRPPGARR
ncbi:MAG: hypothetical protein ACREF1_14175 [Acetobacteraceae bacterium]